MTIIETPIFKYEGSIINKKRNGFGKQLWKNTNEYYEGEWKDNKLNGSGILININKNTYCEGNFENNALNGIGKQRTTTFTCKHCGQKKFYLFTGEFVNGYVKKNSKKYLCIIKKNHVIRKQINNI